MFFLEFNEVQHGILRLQVQTLCVLSNSKIIYCEIYMLCLSLHWKVYLSNVGTPNDSMKLCFLEIDTIFFPLQLV